MADYLPVVWAFTILLSASLLLLKLHPAPKMDKKEEKGASVKDHKNFFIALINHSIPIIQREKADNHNKVTKNYVTQVVFGIITNIDNADAIRAHLDANNFKGNVSMRSTWMCSLSFGKMAEVFILTDPADFAALNSVMLTFPGVICVRKTGTNWSIAEQVEDNFLEISFRDPLGFSEWQAKKNEPLFYAVFEGQDDFWASIARKSPRNRLVAKYKAGIYYIKIVDKVVACQVQLSKTGPMGGDPIYWAPGTEISFAVNDSRQAILTKIRSAIRGNPHTPIHGLDCWVRLEMDATPRVIEACFSPLIEKLLDTRR